MTHCTLLQCQLVCIVSSKKPIVIDRMLIVGPAALARTVSDDELWQCSLYDKSDRLQMCMLLSLLMYDRTVLLCTDAVGYCNTYQLFMRCMTSCSMLLYIHRVCH